MGRPLHKHIDSDELAALVPSREGDGDAPRLCPENVREAAMHVASCKDCREKVQQYSALTNLATCAPQSAHAGEDCPEGVNWHEVAAGEWPEVKTSQLITHAAMCDHCGPILRVATRMQKDSSFETLLATLKSSPSPVTRGKRSGLLSWLSVWWLAPVFALVVIVALLITRGSSPDTAMSGSEFSELAATTHQQHLKGKVALELHSSSQTAINDWLKAKSSFPLALPDSPVTTDNTPYQPEGVRLVQVRDKQAAFITYAPPRQLRGSGLQAEPVSLVVIPSSVAVASGGVVAKYPKVSFHYSTVRGYRVVTWSQHALTYALVSHELNGTQRSCMVCHSAMRDRDLTHTPTPLARITPFDPVL
ncbi:MAG TPA: hypothetical protein VMS18_29445 [Candidatus Binatia bacterium]|nr:hypothetical protein [Candidatus Binatia bacterium]